MDLNDKVTQLEDEIKILKNEVQSVLLDLRESFLNNVNPFNPGALLTHQAPPPVITGDDQELQPSIDTNIQVLTEEDEIIPGVEPEIEEETEEDFPEFEEDDDEDDDMPVFGDITTDQSPGFFPDSSGQEEAAQKEDTMVWHTEANTTTQFRPSNIPGPAVTPSAEPITPDLEWIARLSIWVEDSVNILGHERTRTIIDITETLGYIEPDLKSILVKFIHPGPDGENKTVTTRDYLKCLVELNQLLKSDNRQEVALLFILILSQEYDDR